MTEGKINMVNHFNKSKSQKKIVVAMDSFKGSLTSLGAGNAVRDGILEKYPDIDVQIFPVADGGEARWKHLPSEKSMCRHEQSL